MAKSLRSKRERKRRAEKRQVNAKKELVKLKEVVSRLHKTSEGQITKVSLEEALPDVEVTETPMQLDPELKQKRPVINNQWMNQRKIKAIKRKIKRHNRKKSRGGSAASLRSRRKRK